MSVVFLLHLSVNVTQAPTPPIISTGFGQIKLNSMKAQHACALLCPRCLNKIYIIRCGTFEKEMINIKYK